MDRQGDRQNFRDCLRTAESRTQYLSAALMSGEPDLVAQAATDMQQSAMALSAVLQRLQVHGALEQELAQRLRQLGQTLSMQRDACRRRSAVVDRALHSVIPATRTGTYQGGPAPYGQQARRSGAFKVMSA